MQMERNTIIEYLISSGAEVDANSLSEFSLMDLIDTLIDHAMETELDYLNKKTLLHNGILAFKNQKRSIKVGDSPSLS